MEKNKTGKYLKYAIGEILLVVIGILIALQINNWNEGRKNKHLVNTYVEGLIENLAEDSLKISETLTRIEAEVEDLEQFERRVSTSPEPLDTILKIARFEYKNGITLHYDYQNDTYQVLNSTGNIGLLKNDLIKDLNELYNLQDRQMFSTTETFDIYKDGLIRYGQKYPYTFKTNLIRNDTKAASEIWDNISLSDHATVFNALIIAKGDSYRLSLMQLPLIQDKTNKLLTKLRAQH